MRGPGYPDAGPGYPDAGEAYPVPGSVEMRPRCTPRITASAFECAPSLLKMRFTWLRTVCSVMSNAAPISAVERPFAIDCRISTSRSDRRPVLRSTGDAPVVGPAAGARAGGGG